ncbi:MAG: sulfatase [Holophagales bacterium]|nr:sulfatase [Holophagales bacterium]MYC09058.1 sulfatase [Holophagales bacterium]
MTHETCTMRQQTALLLLGAVLSVPCASQPADRSDQLLLAAAAPNRETGLEERPNVLFIVADDLNVALGAYLDSAPSPQYAGAKTPNLDRLAAEGVRFDRAYVQNPLCNPSRTSFLSGLRPPTTDIYNGQTPPRTKIGDDLRMLPEHFHDHGYFTARVGKIAHNIFEHAVSWDVSNFALSREPEIRLHLPGYLPGVDLSAERDNTWVDGSEDGMSRADVLRTLGRPAGLPLSWRATRESPRMTPDGTTATRIVQLMARNRDRPFFIAAGFHKPHQPWVGPVEFFDQHPVDEIQLPETPPDDTDDLPAAAFRILPDDAAHTERQRKQAIAAYHAMVTMTDFYVGELLDALELLDLADSTIVVFTSDHGFQLNEHGGLWRKTVQFEESTRVPLLVRLPGGGQAGEVAAGLVELVDLYPTLVELCNLPAPAHELEGTSFRPLLDDPARPWKSAAFSESKRGQFHGRTLRTQRYRYTEWTPLRAAGGETERELYDLEEDPFEYENLASDPGRREQIEELSRRLRAGWRAALPESI